MAISKDLFSLYHFLLIDFKRSKQDLECVMDWRHIQQKHTFMCAYAEMFICVLTVFHWITVTTIGIFSDIL